ncbi:MAG: hypothetical protein ACYDBQ_08825 [Thermoplasmatota archaeon]
MGKPGQRKGRRRCAPLQGVACSGALVIVLLVAGCLAPDHPATASDERAAAAAPAAWVAALAGGSVLSRTVTATLSAGAQANASSAGPSIHVGVTESLGPGDRFTAVGGILGASGGSDQAWQNVSMELACLPQNVTLSTFPVGAPANASHAWSPSPGCRTRTVAQLVAPLAHEVALDATYPETAFGALDWLVYGRWNLTEAHWRGGALTASYAVSSPLGHPAVAPVDCVLSNGKIVRVMASWTEGGLFPFHYQVDERITYGG